jgi:hypothetical protein
MKARVRSHQESASQIIGALATGMARRVLAEALGVDARGLASLERGSKPLERKQQAALTRVTGLSRSRLILRGLASSSRMSVAERRFVRETDRVLKLLHEAQASDS